MRRPRQWAITALTATALTIACTQRAAVLRPNAAAIDSATGSPLEYSVRYTAADPGTLTVSLRARDLARTSKKTMIALPDWGAWTTAPEPYVANLRIDGSALSFDATGQLVVPRTLAEDGQLDVTYQLRLRDAGSPAHLERHLLPYRDAAHVFGFAENTLARVLVDGRQIHRSTNISIETAADDVIFTGWGGRSIGQQTAKTSGEFPAENGIFAIGRMAGWATRSVAGVPVEIAQFATGPDLTAEIAGYVESLVAAMSRSTGRAPRGPLRIIVEPQRQEGVFSGTHTNDGLVVRLPAGPLSQPAKLTLAHELFHDWLGSHLVEEDESLTWFQEGFTDYISLWHATAAGVVTPAEFAERMFKIESEARASTSLGRIRFAEAGTRWRDGDGANETMAYRGGALLAFLADTELRRRGATVTDLIRHLLSRPQRKYGLEDIRTAMTRLGVSDVYRQSIDGTHVPTVRPMLIAAGFDEGAAEPAALTYLGIETRYENADPMSVVPAIVLAIDAAGPAAKVDLRVGDRIIDIGERRGDPPIIGPEELTRYRFGLNVVPSSARTVTLRVERSGSVKEVQVAPVRRAGGLRHPLRWNPERGAAFLTIR